MTTPRTVRLLAMLLALSLATAATAFAQGYPGTPGGTGTPPDDGTGPHSISAPVTSAWTTPPQARVATLSPWATLLGANLPGVPMLGSGAPAWLGRGTTASQWRSPLRAGASRAFPRAGY